MRPPEDPDRNAGAAPVPADHGNTMVHSTASRVRAPVREAHGARPTRALLLAEGRRHVLPPGGAVLGRSRESDVVLADENVSRHHAEVRPAQDGTWTIRDLGSTNGVRVNGRQIAAAQPLASGDRIVLGTAEIGFDLE